MRKKILSMFIFLILILCFIISYKYNQNVSINNCSKFTNNSKEYWDCRFKTLDWQRHHGDMQTLHFYVLLVNGLSNALQNEFQNNKYTVVDFGCAQGEGTEFFAEAFPNLDVLGVDISSEAIKIAKQKTIKSKFLATDLTKENNTWDVLITSNTMEHFSDPWNIINQLEPKIKKYIVILVPFDQPNIPMGEHLYSFNYQNIPQNIGKFTLSDKKIIYPQKNFWAEKQILLTYRNHN